MAKGRAEGNKYGQMAPIMMESGVTTWPTVRASLDNSMEGSMKGTSKTTGFMGLASSSLQTKTLSTKESFMSIYSTASELKYP